MEDTWKKHIQALSVFQWVLTFVFMGSFFTILLLYLMFTSLWIIPVTYFTWLLMDWETPERGGRRTEWVRRWTVWSRFREYFPIKLVQSSPLSPDRNYVLGCHPHGIMSVAAFSNFATEANGFSDVYPGVRPWLAVLAGMFRLPIYRDYIMSAGVVPVSRDSIQYLLSRCGTGNAVFIVVGGAAESLQSSPTENMVTLSGRKGFVRLALQNGADLVPVYSFGENDIFEQWGGLSVYLTARCPRKKTSPTITASTYRGFSSSSTSIKFTVDFPRQIPCASSNRLTSTAWVLRPDVGLGPPRSTSRRIIGGHVTFKSP
ncbi:2-acylglycerol O-acyltransferase 3-like isoform X2 [Spea bombifrons]|uniref:2-acylglycerol O-acyltransferase 3-like isoform X2 n=1 Tax=Spea bombifrons TaxID=233779 RepID=UPI002349D08F|nr:2-acylglycerol O-acyltransferase 3-like isoform X2 [Spea bombifrons]